MSVNVVYIYIYIQSNKLIKNLNSVIKRRIQHLFVQPLVVLADQREHLALQMFIVTFGRYRADLFFCRVIALLQCL